MIDEYLEELERTERLDFYLEMKDFWSRDDEKQHREYRNTINNLLAKIRKFVEEDENMTVEKMQELHEKGYTFEISDGKIVAVLDKDGVKVDGF